MSEHGDTREDHKPHETVIHIDRHEFKVEETSLTGAHLRQVPPSPIGADYDLFLEVPAGEDRLIGDEEVVELKNGLHFFSVQRNINPGA